MTYVHSRFYPDIFAQQVVAGTWIAVFVTLGFLNAYGGRLNRMTTRALLMLYSVVRLYCITGIAIASVGRIFPQYISMVSDFYFDTSDSKHITDPTNYQTELRATLHGLGRSRPSCPCRAPYRSLPLRLIRVQSSHHSMYGMGSVFGSIFDKYGAKVRHSRTNTQFQHILILFCRSFF